MEDNKNTNPHTKDFDWYLLILLSMAQFMVVLDFSIVNVALPVIQKELHFTQSGLQWIVTAYAITFGGLLLLGGRLTDLYGRKIIFIGGLVTFSLVSLTGGLSVSGLMLIAARAAQGIGAAMVLPSSMSLITTNFTEPADREKALSIFGAVGASGFAAGALLGGVLTAFLGWRWILFVNVIIGAVVVVLSLRKVQRQPRKENVKLDLPGAATITTGLALFVYAVTTGGNIGFTNTQVIILGVASIALIAGFIYIESKAEHPLVPLSVFKIPSLRGANITMLVSQAAFAANLLLLAEYLQSVLHYSVLATGFMFLPMGLIVFTMSSYVSPLLMDRIGMKKLIVFGLTVATLGFMPYTRLSAHGSYFADVFPGLIPIAFGFGATFPPLLIVSVAGVPKDEQGLASGLINTARQIGASIGVAILIALVESRAGAAVANNATALDAGIRLAMLGSVIISGVATLAAVVFIKLDKQEEKQAENAEEKEEAVVGEEKSAEEAEEGQSEEKQAEEIDGD